MCNNTGYPDHLTQDQIDMYDAMEEAMCNQEIFGEPDHHNQSVKKLQLFLHRTVGITTKVVRFDWQDDLIVATNAKERTVLYIFVKYSKVQFAATISN